MTQNYNKQIIYPSLFKRVISSMFDMLIIHIIFTPITTLFNQWIFSKKFGVIFAEKDIDINDQVAVMEAFKDPSMAEYLNSNFILDILIPASIFYILSLGIYFIASWHYLGSTPAKYLMHMRIVDQDTYTRPKLSNLIWRFFGYFLFIIGIWFVLFTKRNQALHDKLANTVVIKV
ncbi:MAG UNVERIFIED_CONTAM: RDD family protein [Rickettsiaceae bacterium]|jgi:hypothetical protein